MLRADSSSSGANDQRRTTNDSLRKIRHLHRRQRSFEAFVPHLQASAVDSLFEIFASKHTESMGHASFLSGLPDPARNFVDDNVIVRGVAAQQATQANDGVVFFSLGESACGGWNFKRAWYPNNFDVVLVGPRTQKPVIGTAQQSFRDEFVEAGDDNAEFSSRSA
jgi:hypothetical protein